MKDDRPYLLHVLDALERIEEYVRPGRDAFFADRRTQDAVLRNLEVIGEAAKRLSGAARERAPDIPWRSIAGLRDRLIHQYFSVRLDRVWQVVERELPGLRRRIESMLEYIP